MASKLQKGVSDVVQTFREAQNLLPTLYTHFSALENIMTQKATLAGAVRRREHCFAIQSTSFLSEECQGEEENTRDVREPTSAASSFSRTQAELQSGSQGSPESQCCAHVTTAVATAPLGVLACFGPSTAEHLVAQHQRDEEELLGVISRVTQQSWPQKVDQLKGKMAQVEAQIGAVGETGSATAAPPTLFRQTPAQLSVALYGLVACAVKMASVLQEVTLALRKDTRHSLLSASASPSSSGAAVWADSLASLLARESQRKSDAAALLPLYESNKERQADEPALEVFRRVANVVAPAPEPLTLVEAVGRLADFVKSRWSYCLDVYLAEESQVLLASV